MANLSDSQALRVFVADALEAQARDIVREWIEWLRNRVGTRTIYALPEKALENHIPHVIASLGAFLRAPVDAMGSETIGHLRLHAQIRKEQGYDIQELMVEFDYLAHIINTRMIEVLEQADPGAGLGQAAATFALINTGLRAMGFVTVGVYREKEEQEEFELSSRLKHLADTLAHEVRQPLHSIAMSANMLETELGEGSELLPYVQTIHKGVKRSSELLTELRMLAASEEARQEKDWRGLKIIVDSVVDELQAVANEQGVEIRVDQELPAVEMTSFPVNLALLNLVNNAIKYSDPSKSQAWVEISAEWEQDAERTGACRIDIKDNGIGIPPEAINHVFQRHFRAHPEVRSGLGLGLALARHTLQQYSGDLSVESEEGKGSTFSIRIEGRGEMIAGKDSGEEGMADLLKRSVEASVDSGDGGQESQ